MQLESPQEASHLGLCSVIPRPRRGAYLQEGVSLTAKVRERRDGVLALSFPRFRWLNHSQRCRCPHVDLTTVGVKTRGDSFSRGRKRSLCAVCQGGRLSLSRPTLGLSRCLLGACPAPDVLRFPSFLGASL